MQVEEPLDFVQGMPQHRFLKLSQNSCWHKDFEWSPRSIMHIFDAMLAEERQDPSLHITYQTPV